MHKLAPLAFVAFIACSGSQKTGDGIEQEPITYEDPDDPNKPKDGDAKAAGHLTIVPIKLSDGQQLELTIKEDGSIVAGDKPVGSVNVKGEMLAPNGGLYATLNNDGSITPAHIKAPFLEDLVIDKKGVFKKKGTAIVEISDQGIVSVNGTGFVTLEGPAEGRQAVMFVLAVAMAPQLGQAIDTLKSQPPPEEGTEDPENPCGNPCANPCGG
jgi:hypothetical protein